jgi:outer membrane protein assembly factor BamB
LAAVLASALTGLPLPAADWPQWMGPNRDAVWAESGILDRFPAGGPKLVWKVPVAGGYAGPAVANGKVYVADKALKEGAKDPADPFDTKTSIPSAERVLCLDARTGTELWRHEYDCPYRVSYPAGPRCTPTVAGGKVYTLGTMGDLFCLDADNGSVVWRKNFRTDYDAAVPTWGFAAHPLVYKNLVVCMVGGKGAAVVAFDKDNGREVWRGLNAKELGYCPPTLIEAGGTTQLVIWHGEAISGLNPETGAVYWSEPLRPGYGMAIMAPRRAGDLLYAGGHGAAQVVLKLAADKPAASVVWRQPAVPDGKKPAARGLAPINMTPFVEGGVMYGTDQPGMLRAVRVATGERLWFTFRPITGRDEEEDFTRAGVGTAFIVKNGDRFFLFAETGHLIIAGLSPAGYDERGRAKLLDPTGAYAGRKVVWSHPAFAGRCVFVRNDKEIACYSLARE